MQQTTMEPGTIKTAAQRKFVGDMILGLKTQGKHSHIISRILNDQGWRTGTGKKFKYVNVWQMEKFAKNNASATTLVNRNLPSVGVAKAFIAVKPNGPGVIQDLAAKLAEAERSVTTIKHQLREALAY